MAKRNKKAAQKEQTTQQEPIKLTKLEVEYLPHGDVQPNDYNPNRQSEQDFELLLRSIKEDGFTQPVIVLKETPDGRKNVIVDGEHRWRAAGVLGYTEVPVVRVTMSEAQARLATITHNRARGAENDQLAAQVLKDLAGSEDGGSWLRESLMLDEASVDLFLQDVQVNEVAEAAKADGLYEKDQAELRQMLADETGEEVDETEIVSAADVVRAREEGSKRDRRAADTEKSEMEVSSMHRLKLIFADDEAEVVKRVLKKNSLGLKPADMIVHLCREAKNAAG